MKPDLILHSPLGASTYKIVEFSREITDDTELDHDAAELYWFLYCHISSRLFGALEHLFRVTYTTVLHDDLMNESRRPIDYLLAKLPAPDYRKETP